MSKFLFPVLAITMIGLTVSCSSGDDKDSITQITNATAGGSAEEDTENLMLSDAQKAMVQESNGLALNLLRQLNASHGEHSYVVSPLSVGYVLGMLCEGADQPAQEEIAKALGFEREDVNAISSYYAKLMRIGSSLDKEVTVGLANIIFGNRNLGIEFADEYTQRVIDYYEAEIKSMDFQSEKTLEAINDWSSSKTQGMIPEILSSSEFNPSCAAYLLNAVSFKGAWSQPFDKTETHPEPFTTPTGANREVALMHKHTEAESYGYWKDDRAQYLSMPYANGSFRMMVVLPDAGNDLKGILDDMDWTAVLREQYNTDVDIYLPAFSIETETDLVPLLKSLGIEKVFTIGLTRILKNRSQLLLNIIKQKSRIVVQEEGTTAASTTVGGLVGADIGGRPTPKEFRADHPFAFFIYEKSTGIIFFVGKFTGE